MAIGTNYMHIRDAKTLLGQWYGTKKTSVPIWENIMPRQVERVQVWDHMTRTRILIYPSKTLTSGLMCCQIPFILYCEFVNLEGMTI
jgi:hypothetical protein